MQTIPSKTLARELMSKIGPGRLLLVGDAPADFIDELSRMGNLIVDLAASQTTAVPGYTAVLVCGDMIGIRDSTIRRSLLQELLPVLSDHLVLLPVTFRGTKEDNWEERWTTDALQIGFRRALSAFDITEFHRLNRPTCPDVVILEPLAQAARTTWPIEALLPNRGLHMDMSREFSPRADAHMVRYALAAQKVRPNDVVLDCACGLGYGSALLAAQSGAARIIGVDIEPTGVAYARDSFSERYGIQFEEASADALTFLEDGSIDLIVSFETIEHVPDYEKLVVEFSRVLKPDGRIIASVPNLWVDETGRDPNPYHFHAFDYTKFSALISRHFLIEERYAQEAPGGFKLVDRARRLMKIPLDSPPEDDTEWWIIVASNNPLLATTGQYTHPEFYPPTGKPPQVVDFSSFYHNPWIYRSIIQLGQRIADEPTLASLALTILETEPPDSADFGAATCILAYQTLSNAKKQDAGNLLTFIDHYLSLSSQNPHVVRWKISLSYVGGLLSLLTGNRPAAVVYFGKTMAIDPLEFSPLLATKTIAAAFWSAVIALVDGKCELARGHFRYGTETATRALKSIDREAVGDGEKPLLFGFQEIAEIADMASQCANALGCLDLYPRAPGYFWRRIDERRFGLATWLLNLERENSALRQAR